ARWRRASARLQDELGLPPTHEEVARSLNLPEKKLAFIKKAIRVYNTAPEGEGRPAQGYIIKAEDLTRVYNTAPPTDENDEPPESGWSLDEMAMDGHSESPDRDMAEADDLQHVLVLLDRMDKRESTVLRMRFGLDDEEPKTLKEIGERLGLTRERVRQ